MQRIFHASGLEYDKLYIRKENGGWIEADVITGYIPSKVSIQIYIFLVIAIQTYWLIRLILNTTDNTVTSEFKRCYDIVSNLIRVKNRR